jgi:hypothetical protein
MALKKRAIVLLMAPVAVLLLAMDACDGVASVTIDEGDLTLVVGETRDLAVTVITRGGADRAVTWSSSDPHAATVNQQGTVTALAEGVTRIAAESVADASKSDTVSLTVTAGEAPTTAGVRTSQSVYGPFEEVLVTFAGFPGDRQEWITIVPATAPDDAVGEGCFTAGARAGEITFPGLAPGDYEVRAYFDWPHGGFVVEHRHGFEVRATASDGWLDPDAVDQAWHDLLDGATEVQLSADGRMTYRYEHLAGETLREEFLRGGHVFAWWESTEDSARAAFDVNFDGQYDEEIAVTQAADDQWEKVTTRWTTGRDRIIFERRTVRRDGERVHVTVERPDHAGTLRVLQEYVAPVVQPLSASDDVGDVEPLILDRRRVRHHKNSTCSPEERERLNSLWLGAVYQGLDCLWSHGQTADAAELAREFHRRPVLFTCHDTPLAGNETAVAWLWTRDGPIAEWLTEHLRWPIEIELYRPEFFDPKFTDNDRAAFLFHELLHVTMGPHDPGLEQRSPTWPARARHDRVYACQLFCFSDDRQDRLAYCEGCLATGAYGQDGACNDACDIYAKDAWYCPCKANPTDYGWHDSRTACAVNCPRGLGCFPYSCRSRDDACQGGPHTRDPYW